MGTSAELRAFLTTRRARLTPALMGLPDYGGRRRVPGLRREEVALLAGMSAEYYTRFERGNATGVSASILEGVGRALRLDAAERAHLADLVRSASDDGRPRRHELRVRPAEVSRSVRQLLHAMTGVPALVQNRQLDVVAANPLGRALFADMWGGEDPSANFARFLFLDRRSLDFYRDRADSAAQLVSLLRAETGRAPHDSELASIIEELRGRSTEFSRLWDSHDVDDHTTGVKRISHPRVGDLELDYDALPIPDTDGLLLIAWTAAIGTPSADALALLANLAATVPGALDRAE